jgi:hypothetical protein
MHDCKAFFSEQNPHTVRHNVEPCGGFYTPSFGRSMRSIREALLIMPLLSCPRAEKSSLRSPQVLLKQASSTFTSPRSTAPRSEAKNMPQAYFLYAPTLELPRHSRNLTARNLTVGSSETHGSYLPRFLSRKRAPPAQVHKSTLAFL